MVKNLPAMQEIWVQSLGWLWRRKWLPTPVFLPGKSHGQRSLVGYSPWGGKESDTTEWLTLSIIILIIINQLFLSETIYNTVFIGFFSRWFAFGFKSVFFFFFPGISQIFISKLFQNNHENISNSNKKKKSYTFWSLIHSGCSLCIISCYDINGWHMYFYNEWRRVHEVFLLATRTLFSSRTNNWTLLWGVQS